VNSWLGKENLDCDDENNMGAINEVSCEGLCCCIYCNEKINDVGRF
jgi:hypothetical protein